MAKYVKPTLETKFHVDFSWWHEKGENLRAFLQGHTCTGCEEMTQDAQDQPFDWIDPETGQVSQIDILWHVIHTQCQDDPEFFDSRVPLTSAIFRAFIANNNMPLTAVEIHERIQKKTPDLILRTIGKRIVYKGIKPVDTSI